MCGMELMLMPVMLPIKQAVEFHHRYCEKAAKQELAYFKYVGLLFIAIAALKLMEVKGLVSNFLMGSSALGLGILLILIMNIFFISSEIDQMKTVFEDEGIAFENKYPSIFYGYFKASIESKKLSYRASLFYRLAPCSLVGAYTIWSAIQVSLASSLGLAVLVGSLSTVILLCVLRLISIKTRRWQRIA